MRVFLEGVVGFVVWHVVHFGPWADTLWKYVGKQMIAGGREYCPLLV